MVGQLQSHARRETLRATTYRVTSGVLGVLGAVATAVGVVVLVAGEDEYVGLGGPSTSWRVGDLSPGWGYALVAGGLLAIVGAFLLARHDRAHAATEVRSVDGWPDFVAHAAIFVVVNTFVWLQDIAIGAGLNYAIWVTVPWALGLTAHGVSTYLDERQRAASEHHVGR